MQTPEERAFGCLFCLTGKEQTLAEEIRRNVPDVRTLVSRLEKHRSCQGKKTRSVETAFPGYVFFEARPDFAPSFFQKMNDAIYVLEYEIGKWQLMGQDEKFVRWLFQNDGLLSFSKAVKEGEQVRIISGPLKDFEGCVRKIDRRGRSGLMELDFNGRVARIWLGFELVDAEAEEKPPV